jgi:hypothetical protein
VHVRAGARHDRAVAEHDARLTFEHVDGFVFGVVAVKGRAIALRHVALDEAEAGPVGVAHLDGDERVEKPERLAFAAGQREGGAPCVQCAFMVCGAFGHGCALPGYDGITPGVRKGFGLPRVQ